MTPLADSVSNHGRILLQEVDRALEVVCAPDCPPVQAEASAQDVDAVLTSLIYDLGNRRTTLLIRRFQSDTETPL